MMNAILAAFVVFAVYDAASSDRARNEKNAKRYLALTAALVVLDVCVLIWKETA